MMVIVFREPFIMLIRVISATFIECIQNITAELMVIL